jgi:eukaryotic-like serine/threonine-protein kinase
VALTGVSTALSALVDECLYKAPGARPTPANVERRLAQLGSTSESSGLTKLRQANREEVTRLAEVARRESRSRSIAESRRELAQSASVALTQIRETLRDAITGAASSAREEAHGGQWSLQLNQARLTFFSAEQIDRDPWRWDPPAFDVVSHAAVELRIPTDRTNTTDAATRFGTAMLRRPMSSRGTRRHS